MAQTGYTPIQLYYSSTASAVPLAANLAAGELAINTTDGKLYYKSNAGVVTLLAGATSGPAGGSNTQVQYNSSGVLAGSANMTFNGTTLTVAGFSNTGNTILGDASADTVTVNGTITSNLIFTDATYDIGAAGATRPRNYYGSGGLTAGGVVTSTSSTGYNFTASNNQPTGYSALRLLNDQNSYSRALELDYFGTSYAGAPITGGVAGEQGVISVVGAYPLYFGTSNTARMYLGGTGNIYAKTNLLFEADATYDIGNSGLTARARNLYLGGTAIDLRNTASVGLTLTSSATQSQIIIDANTSGTAYSNVISFYSSGVAKWYLGGGNVGPNGNNDFTLLNFATSQTVMNVPTGGRAVYFPGKLSVNGASAANQPVTVQADTNGHSLWTINDATLGYGQIYFGGSASSGFQGIRADGRTTTGWLDIITQDTRRMRFNADGSASFYNGVLTFDAAYPFFNNIASGSIKTIMAFNTSGTYYAALFDSGGSGAAGSKLYWSRTSGVGAAYSNSLFTLDFQNARIGINTPDPGYELDIRGGGGAGSVGARIKAVTSGTAGLILDSASNSGGLSTQISFGLNGASKWAFGYANIGASGPNDMGLYNYTTNQTPWIMSSTDYQRLPRTAAFLVTISANYSSTGTSVVKFDTVVTDNRSNFDTANYRFVAPVDGYYQFNATVNQYSVSSGTFLEWYFRKNGSTAYAGPRIVSGTSSDQNTTGSLTIYLATNDYIDVFSNTAGGFSSSIRWNLFSGYLIG